MVVHHNPAYKNLQVIGPGHAWMVDKQFLRSKLEKKVEQYRNIVQQLRIPLVIAIASTFNSGLGFDDLEDVIFGQEAVSFHVDNLGSIVGQAQPTRHWRDGLFLNETEIAGVIWMDSQGHETAFRLIENPYAVPPLGPLNFEVTQSISAPSK